MTSDLTSSNDRQTILVTGATGLIGKRLVAELLNAQHQIIVLSRRPEKAAKLGNGIRLVRTMIELPASLALDAIIHLAGEPVASRLWTDARLSLIHI